jgi:hypothetical protein
MLGEVPARSSGKTAVVARTKGRRSLILELYGESGAQGEEVIEAIKALVASHYRPV